MLAVGVFAIGPGVGGLFGFGVFMGGVGCV